MTPPVTPWTSRLVRSRRLLAAGVAAALATTATSFYLARDDGRQPYERAAAGTSARIGNGTFRLDGVHDVGVLAGTYEAERPVAGATFVVVDLDADLSGLGTGESCLIHLMAGDYAFDSALGYRPPEPARSGCESGTRGTIELAFEVPQRLVDAVDGVRVDVATDAGVVSTLLPAQVD